MAEQVEIIDINLDEIINDGQQAGQTLKELKEEVKDLRKQLDDCQIGTSDFASTLDELTTAQDKLKKATKTSIGVVEGSYDALASKMSDLKKAWRATADEAERANLGQQIADINQQLKDMDGSIGNYQRNVGDYASAFDNVTMKIEGGVAKFERFNNVSRSIIGSFDLVEGSLKAIGVESEEVNSLMNSMQGAMMLTNGLQSIKEGVQVFTSLKTSVSAATVAQTALNGAMLANPIGAVVLAVTALIAGITTLVSVIKKNRDEEKQLKEAYEATNKVINDRIAKQELEIQLMEARGVAQSEILKQELEYAKLNEKTTRDRITAIEKELEATGTLRFKKKNLLKEQLNDLKEQLKEQEEAVRDANNAILIYDTKTQREQTDREREQANERIRIAKEETDKKLEEQKRYNEALKTQYNQLLEVLRTYRMTAYEKEVDDTVKKYNNDVKLLKDAYKNKIIPTQEEYFNKLRELREKFNYDMGILQAEQIESEGNAATITAETTAKTQKDLDDEAEKVKTLGDAIKENLNLTDQQFNNISAGVGLVGTAFGQTAQLLNTLSQQQDKTSKEGFEAAKKMSIAAATMSMLQGIISSWTSAMSLPAPISFITGGIMSAFTATMGGIQIAQIKKQKFNGGQDSGSGNTPQAPQINTAALLSSPVNYTTEIQGAKAIEDVKDTRVYVLESDISNTIDKVRVVEEESTY